MPPSEIGPEIASGSYATDTITSVYDRICKLDANIEFASAAIEKYGRDKANSKADYERLKNGRLLLMYEQERSGESPKRTEKHRQVLYRDAFAQERFDMQIAEMMYDAAVKYLDGLKSSLTAAQTRLNTLTAQDYARGTGRG